VDAESLALHEHNDAAEVQRLTRRVSELSFGRHEIETTALQQLHVMQLGDERGMSETSASTSDDPGGGNSFHAEFHRLLLSHEQMSDAASKADAANAHLRAEISTLRRELTVSESCAEEHARRCAFLEESLSRQQQEMKGLQQALADVEEDRSKALAEIAALEAQACTLAASCDDLRRQSSASRLALSACEAATRALEQDRDSISERLDKAQQALINAHQQISDAASYADAVNAERRSEISALRRELEEFFSHTQHGFTIFRQVLAEFDVDRAKFLDAQDALEKEIASLMQLRLDESRTFLTESQEITKNYSQYCDLIDARLSEAQQQLSDALQQMSDAASKADAANAHLRAEISTLRRELTVSESCAEEHARRCAFLEESLSRQQQEMKGLQQALADALVFAGALR
jgi:chromosome segregation ATPase